MKQLGNSIPNYALSVSPEKIHVRITSFPTETGTVWTPKASLCCDLPTPRFLGNKGEKNSDVKAKEERKTSVQLCCCLMR